MSEVTDASIEHMGNFNNTVIALMETSGCNLIEVITVLDMIASRLRKSFELQVMGSPMNSIVERVSGNNLEKDSI